jgi:hypothetical protein
MGVQSLPDTFRTEGFDERSERGATLLLGGTPFISTYRRITNLFAAHYLVGSAGSALTSNPSLPLLILPSPFRFRHAVFLLPL